MIHMQANSHARIFKLAQEVIFDWLEIVTSSLTLLSPPMGGQGFLGGVATPDSG